MKKLSIITVNLNNANGLEKTIKSVIEQIFQEFEFIIIDGNSKDESVEIIKKYVDKISYWVSEKDTGIYNAMNKGIKKASGEYLLFLNSGDFLVDKNVLKKIFSETQTADILYGELIFDFKNEKKKLAKLTEKLTTEYLFADNIWHPASFIKKKLFSAIGLYNEKYKIAADYDFFFNAIAVKKSSTHYLEFPISVYDTDGLSSVPQNSEKIIAERKAIHQSYLNKEELEYFNHFKVLKRKTLSKCLVNKPIASKLIYALRELYSRIK